MTKGRAALPLSVVTKQTHFSSPWVGRRPLTSPVEVTRGRVASDRQVNAAPVQKLLSPEARPYPLSSRPERTRISYFTLLATTTCLHRKSGGAQWRDLRSSGPFLAMFFRESQSRFPTLLCPAVFGFPPLNSGIINPLWQPPWQAASTAYPS